jgi:transcriptional regulator with XRE-family HTH domain
MIGVNSTTVSHWKNRGSTPNARTVRALADYFNMSIEELLYGSETERNDPHKLLKDRIDGMTPEELERFESMFRLMFPEKFEE